MAVHRRPRVTTEEPSAQHLAQTTGAVSGSIMRQAGSPRRMAAAPTGAVTA